jgi:hypothetical protein
MAQAKTICFPKILGYIMITSRKKILVQWGCNSGNSQARVLKVLTHDLSDNNEHILEVSTFFS